MPETTRRRRLVVAVSLSEREVAETDRLVEALDDHGWPGVSRSMVIRMAIGYFSASVRGKSPEQLVEFLIQNRVGR